MAFQKAATNRGAPCAGGGEGGGKAAYVPYDFSSIVTTHAQIKTVFRENETREQNFNESREKQQNRIVQVLLRNKLKEREADQAAAHRRDNRGRPARPLKYDRSAYHLAGRRGAEGSGAPAMKDHDCASVGIGQPRV